MARPSSSPPIRPEVNLAPLIDITLVLLIILMVGIPEELRRIEMAVQVPPPTTRTTPSDEPQIVIAVYEDGSLAIDQELVAADALQAELVGRLAERERKQVFVDAAGKVSYGTLVDAVDAAREAGAEGIGLARLKPEGPRPPRSPAPE